MSGAAWATLAAAQAVVWMALAAAGDVRLGGVLLEPEVAAVAAGVALAAGSRPPRTDPQTLFASMAAMLLPLGVASLGSSIYPGTTNTGLICLAGGGVLALLPWLPGWPLAALLGIRGIEALVSSSAISPVMAIVCVAAVAAALLRRPTLGALFLAIGVAGLDGGHTAAVLLAAGAALAAMAPVPPSLASLLPGFVAIASVVATPTAVAPRLFITLAALAVLGSGVVTLGSLRPVRTGEHAALAVGAWLFVAPETWEWARAASLHAYQEGMGRAVAVGLLAAMGAILAPVVVGPKGPPEPEPRRPPGRRRQ